MLNIWSLLRLDKLIAFAFFELAALTFVTLDFTVFDRADADLADAFFGVLVFRFDVVDFFAMAVSISSYMQPF